MKLFANRRILFIGIGFYDYETSIVARLREHGAEVTAFTDQPKCLREGLAAALVRRTGMDARRIMQRHEAHMLNACSKYRFDQVLVIKGIALSTEFLCALKAQQPAAEFILYQWDSLERLPGVREKLPYFHRVLTFDRKDAIQYPDIAFRPLFYREAPATGASDMGRPIDIAFVGWLHSDRLAAVRKMQTEALAQGLTPFVYLYTGLFTWLRLALKGQARDVHFVPLSYEKLMAINARARVILDLPHAAQSGMTMRTIEAMGSGKKLITTGQDIVHYDFYSADRVKLVDLNDIKIDASFVSKKPLPLPEKIRRKYTLDAWLTDILKPAMMAS